MAGVFGSGICCFCDMAKEIKRIPVADQEQAVTVINRLSQQYAMQSDTQRHQLHVSNSHFAAYYDVAEGVVKLETVHSDRKSVV